MIKGGQTPSDGITVIIAAPSLLKQWERELHDFVDSKQIDILEYTRSKGDRTSWWNTQYKSCSQPLQCRKVFLVSPRVSPILFATTRY